MVAAKFAIYKIMRAMNEILQRNHDFLQRCRQEYARLNAVGKCPGMKEVIERVLAGGAPAYYVEFGYARRVVADLFRRGVLDRCHDGTRGWSRRDMMIEIGFKCKHLVDAGGCSLTDALARVLASSAASSFFMTRSYARQLYYSLRPAPGRKNAEAINVKS